MKITLHPLSLVAGIVLTVLVALATGAAQATNFTAAPLGKKTRFLGGIPAAWWVHFELSNLNGGIPEETFTVPQGRNLVVTSMRSLSELYVDDLPFPGPWFAPLESAQSSDGNGTRLVFGPGTHLETRYGMTNTGHLWGYLEPVN